jgi:hypothetical protein
MTRLPCLPYQVLRCVSLQVAYVRHTVHATITHRERCISDFRATVTGHPTDGHAHLFIIKEAPSEHHHPLWSAATAMEKDVQGKKSKRPRYSQRTTSTALQLAVDHAFTGSYAK